MRVVVAGLMAVMTLLVGCDSATPSFGQPSDLVGSWKLIDLRGFDGAAHTAPDGALTLRFSGGWVANGCGSTPGNVGIGTLHVFEHEWRSRLVGRCPDISDQQSHFVFGKVLTGITSWKIRNDELTLSRNGAAAVFQNVGAG